MTYFLVRVLVYTFAAWVVLQVVPGLEPPPAPFVAPPYSLLVTYLLIGLTFGALQAVGRPLLLFFLGRLYIWSLGTVSVLVTGLLFLVLALLSPNPLSVPGGEIFSATFGALLMGVVATFLEAVTGLDSPRRDTETRTTPRY